MSYFDKILGTILEDVENKIPMLVKALSSAKSKWQSDISPEQLPEFILSLTRWDPTGNQGMYVPYIVKQLTVGNLRIYPDVDEDGPRIKEALTYFHKNKNKAGFKLPKDINQIPNWHTLESNIESGDIQSKREKKKLVGSKGVEKVFEFTVPNNEKTTYTVFKFTEPEALAKWGYGTKWCTTELSDIDTYGRRLSTSFTYANWHENAGETRDLQKMTLSTGRSGYPFMASYYLNDGNEPGPVYIVFRKNLHDQGNVGGSGQYLQIHAGTHQIKNVLDAEMSRCSPALDYALAHWKTDDSELQALIRDMRQKCKDYEGRP